ncbi:polysaccharide deacetylase family protein [Maribacter sp. 2307ULW6-5]|uniref:polysaccharide deacetylase family protein n=1 Tax=Maribacter sp. 2307ULW6-5 TaxID=3386275 RepID=UPI0039BD523C
MLLIYTHKVTPRVSYVMRQLFTGILGLEVAFTATVEEFIRHTGPKITYTRQPLQNEFFVQSADLLFAQGTEPVHIEVSQWDGVPCFFATGGRSALPYDVFAASFYLLSRYEEYLPHEKDAHGRFSPKASLAHEHHFLQRPVVDIWAHRVLELLRERFPEMLPGPRQYSFTSVIDVTTSHCYAYKGVIRGISGLFLDAATLKLRRVGQRLGVWLNLIKDPYDNFAQLIQWHRSLGVHSIFFFQFADYSRFDKNVSINNNRFKALIKQVADYGVVSLAASYSSFDDLELLQKEKQQLEQVVHRPLNRSRMRYNRLAVPETYRNLVAAEFTRDYTMGYTHEMGFRAGTCTPFFFYDIPLELQQPIKVHPFAAHDYTFRSLGTKERAKMRLDALYHEVKKVGGDFITVFSNELLGDEEGLGWMELYHQCLKKYHV